MRSQSAVLLGSLKPQILHLPPDVHSHDAAEEVIELADAYGICGGFPLDESQKFTLRAGLGVRKDGTWAASTVADFEPRQNGKNDTVAARELGGLVLLDEDLLIHTAHEFPTANESFLRLEAVFTNWDDLRRKVKRFRYGHGEQAIEMLTGQRLLYKTRTGAGARGFAKADLVVYDEAQHLRPEHLAASAPAKLANPNSQSWYSGSGGLSTSVPAWRLRKRALRKEPGRYAYLEHTAERIRYDENGRLVSVRPTDLLDRRHWARANAAYGHRVHDESFLDLYGELGPELFARECLNLWDPEPEVLEGEQPLSLEDWGQRMVAKEDIPAVLARINGRRVLGIGVTLGGTSSSVGSIAGLDDGKSAFVQASRVAAGAGWVASAVDTMLAEAGSKISAVGMPGDGPALSIHSDVQAVCDRRGVELILLSGKKYTSACEGFVRRVLDDQVLHAGQVWLSTAIGGAQKRATNSGKSWEWDLVPQVADVSPLIAITCGLDVLYSRPWTPPPATARSQPTEPSGRNDLFRPSGRLRL
jgi:hypothetical protein